MPLRHLGELHLVSDENQVASGLAHGHRIRERYLAGFVDEQVVELPRQVLPAEDPRCAAHEDGAVAEDADVVLRLDGTDRAARRERLLVAAHHLVERHLIDIALELARERDERSVATAAGS